MCERALDDGRNLRAFGQHLDRGARAISKRCAADAIERVAHGLFEVAAVRHALADAALNFFVSRIEAELLFRACPAEEMPGIIEDCDAFGVERIIGDDDLAVRSEERR